MVPYWLLQILWWTLAEYASTLPLVHAHALQGTNANTVLKQSHMQYSTLYKYLMVVSGLVWAFSSSGASAEPVRAFKIHALDSSGPPSTKSLVRHL